MKGSRKDNGGGRRPGRFVPVMTALLALLILAAAVSILAGSSALAPAELLRSENDLILRLRVSRALLAVAAGASLAVAGMVFQAVLGNPLADPYLLGTSSGASLGTVILLLAGAGGTTFLPLGAFLGALLAVVLVYRLAKFGRKLPAETLILSGVVVSSIFSSLLLLLISLAPYQTLHSAVWWLLGNLEIFEIKLLAGVGVVAVSGIALILVFANELNLLTLGEEAAEHLGMRVERDKKILLALASLITGATVSACGLIGFIGLIVPHYCRLLVGSDHRRLIPAAALTGALFLLAADVIGRLLFAPRAVPVGVITALAGGPFFLLLLRRKKGAEF